MSAVKCLKNAFFLKNKKIKKLEKVVDKARTCNIINIVLKRAKNTKNKTRRHVRLAQLDRAFGYGPKVGGSNPLTHADRENRKALKRLSVFFVVQINS